MRGTHPSKRVTGQDLTAVKVGDELAGGSAVRPHRVKVERMTDKVLFGPGGGSRGWYRSNGMSTTGLSSVRIPTESDRGYWADKAAFEAQQKKEREEREAAIAADPRTPHKKMILSVEHFMDEMTLEELAGVAALIGAARQRIKEATSTVEQPEGRSSC